MANKIKGIIVEIGGDTTKLDKALSGVNQSLRDTQSDLNEINRLLKLDPKNVTLLAQKQKALTKAVEDTKTKLNTLRTAAEQAATALEEGTVTGIELVGSELRLTEEGGRIYTLELGA